MTTQGEEHLKFWQERLKVPNFVYVIQGNEGTPVKIGTARNPKRRLGELQTGSYQRLRLLHVLPGDRHLEVSFHERLADCHVMGEWYEGLNVNRFLEFVGNLADEMVAHHDGTGNAPGLKPANPDRVELPEYRQRRWREIADGWLAGLTRRQIAAAAMVTEEQLEIEIVRMRAEGGYTLPEGLIARPPQKALLTFGNVSRLGGFRQLQPKRRKREPAPVTVRHIEPDPVEPLTREEEIRAANFNIRPSDLRRMKRAA